MYTMICELPSISGGISGHSCCTMVSLIPSRARYSSTFHTEFSSLAMPRNSTSSISGPTPTASKVMPSSLTSSAYGIVLSESTIDFPSVITMPNFLDVGRAPFSGENPSVLINHNAPDVFVLSSLHTRSKTAFVMFDLESYVLRWNSSRALLPKEITPTWTWLVVDLILLMRLLVNSNVAIQLSAVILPEESSRKITSMALHAVSFSEIKNNAI